MAKRKTNHFINQLEKGGKENYRIVAGIMNKLKKLDVYPKINEDFYSLSLSGGVITIVSSIVMLLLFFSELRLYVHPAIETKLLVDTSRGETLRINFDVTFPAVACSILSLDAMDISGEQQLDVKHDIVKKRLDAHGNVIEVRPDGIGILKIEKPLQRHGGRLEHNETYCGSCYGAEEADDQCCNSCEDVRDAYRSKGWAFSNPDMIDQCKREGFLQKIKDEDGEGCNIYGSLEVNKVAGNFHFAPGKSFEESSFHIHDLQAFQKDSFNVKRIPIVFSFFCVYVSMSYMKKKDYYNLIMLHEQLIQLSHKINRLAFGDSFPGVVNPLDGYLLTST
ncbi:hypothetical protein GQ457_07G023470 [Hibiscus cannabinus]